MAVYVFLQLVALVIRVTCRTAVADFNDEGGTVGKNRAALRLRQSLEEGDRGMIHQKRHNNKSGNSAKKSGNNRRRWFDPLNRLRGLWALIGAILAAARLIVEWLSRG